MTENEIIQKVQEFIDETDCDYFLHYDIDLE